jgi:CRISPR/Cas system-associated exonuclease Cas4 (RecB family)
MICRTRAFFTAHRRQYMSRRILDMEDSEKRGERFIKDYLFPKFESLETEKLNYILKADTEKKYSIVYGDSETTKRSYNYGDQGVEVICEPDAVLVIKVYNRILRAIVVEISDTDSNIILARRHVIPRILLYMAAAYLHHGVVSAGLYASLSPKSDPPAVLFIQKRSGGRKLTKTLDRVIELLKATQPLAPEGNPPCNHCIYAGICMFRRDHI